MAQFGIAFDLKNPILKSEQPNVGLAQAEATSRLAAHEPELPVSIYNFIGKFSHAIETQLYGLT